MTPPGDSRDSRAVKLDAYLNRFCDESETAGEMGEAAEFIAHVESAGLLVLDPSDEALAETWARLAWRRWCVSNRSVETWERAAEYEREEYREQARDFLRALAGNEPGGKT